MDDQDNIFSSDEDMFVTLDMDDGTQKECRILTIFEQNDQDYIVLLPLEDEAEGDDSDVFIFRYFEDDEGNPSLENILTDEEYEAVEAKFDELIDEISFEEE